MRIVIYHASKYGNGAQVAGELRQVMEGRGHQAEVHHIRDASPKEPISADLYILGSPTRFGKPVRGMRRFAKKVKLPAGTRYAVFATHGDATPNKKTGKMPTEEEIQRYRMTVPVLDEILKGRGLVKVADAIFLVTVVDDLKGHLKDGWKDKAEEFASAVLSP